jgi:F-type H+-transporting ATPase subunit b
MFTSLFLLASEAGETEGFGINTNILETNIINIVIILAFLIYAGRGFIGNILSTRLQTIESAITDAEKRKQESIEKLSDQQEKLAQAQSERDRIIAQAQVDAKVARESILKDMILISNASGWLPSKKLPLSKNAPLPNCANK